ncbi:MAG: hypothetical protein NXI24_13530 [bacterium]|nr:hypothetical protein [bacterium]
MSEEATSKMQPASAPASELERKDRLALLFREAVQQKGPGVILVFEGVGVAGIVHTIHRLCQVLDPRHYEAHRFPDEKKADAVFQIGPPLHDYWKRLPKFGDLAIFDGSYYSQAMLADLDRKERKAFIEEIRNFERTLADNGYLVLKICITRREKDLKKELKKERASVLRKALLQKRMRRLFKDFDDRVEELKRLMRKTDAPHAAWFAPPVGDSREVARAVFDYLIARLEEALSLDSRTAVAEFDEAMERVRQMRRQGAV